MNGRQVGRQTGEGKPWSKVRTHRRKSFRRRHNLPALLAGVVPRRHSAPHCARSLVRVSRLAHALTTWRRTTRLVCRAVWSGSAAPERPGDNARAGPLQKLTLAEHAHSGKRKMTPSVDAIQKCMVAAVLVAVSVDPERWKSARLCDIPRWRGSRSGSSV
jgi:hypothetical protein